MIPRILCLLGPCLLLGACHPDGRAQAQATQSALARTADATAAADAANARAQAAVDAAQAAIQDIDAKTKLLLQQP